MVGRKYVAATSGIPLGAATGNNNAKLTIDGTPTRISINVTVAKTSVTFPLPQTRPTSSR